MTEKRLIQVTMLPAASVVIAEEDYRELERLYQDNEVLRGKLSLAEEGLANYQQENERLEKKCAALAVLVYPTHPDPTGKTREPPHCPTCDCGSKPQDGKHD